MKRCNPLEWAAAMQGLQAQAEEIVCAELIYAEENTNDSLSLPGSDSVPGQCGKHVIMLSCQHNDRLLGASPKTPIGESKC